nr:topoisomerase DNA-binding C4 zinc finger domain-containing protein [Paraglaciecola arctica]
MVKRIAKKGANLGNEFMGCSSFPRCRHIEQLYF